MLDEDWIVSGMLIVSQSSEKARGRPSTLTPTHNTSVISTLVIYNYSHVLQLFLKYMF